MMSEVGDFEAKIATAIAAFSDSDTDTDGLRGIRQVLLSCMSFFDRPDMRAFADLLQMHVDEKYQVAMKECGILENEAVTLFVSVFNGIQAEQARGSQDNKKRAMCQLMMTKFIDALDAALPTP